jgi:hypothetical protein
LQYSRAGAHFLAADDRKAQAAYELPAMVNELLDEMVAAGQPADFIAIYSLNLSSRVANEIEWDKASFMRGVESLPAAMVSRRPFRGKETESQS